MTQGTITSSRPTAERPDGTPSISTALARSIVAAIEDDVAAAGWPWDAQTSLLVDALIVLIEQADDAADTGGAAEFGARRLADVVRWHRRRGRRRYEFGASKGNPCLEAGRLRSEERRVG